MILFVNPKPDNFIYPKTYDFIYPKVYGYVGYTACAAIQRYKKTTLRTV